MVEQKIMSLVKDIIVGMLGLRFQT